MTEFHLSECVRNEQGIAYVQTTLSELLEKTDCVCVKNQNCGRVLLTISCPEEYVDIVKAELCEKVAEIVAVSYKYSFFKENLKTGGLNAQEKELLITALIAADLKEDKKYSFDRYKLSNEIAIDGVFNFRLRALIKKWQEIISFMPPVFVNSQLVDFIGYLLENKNKKIFIDNGRVYDSHYRRLKRTALLPYSELNIVREALMADGGQIELSGEVPPADERYLKEFYGDKITFSHFCG